MFEVGSDDGFAIAFPVGLRPVVHPGDDAEVVEQPSLVELALNGLKMKERQTRPKLDRDIRLLDPHIGEERAKPAIRLDDTIEQIVADAAREIRNGTEQQAPARLCSRDQPAPYLHVTRFWKRAEERRRAALDIVGRVFVEIRLEVRELGRAQRIPLFSGTEGPFHVRSVELKREGERRKYVPAESGSCRHGIAIAERPCQQHAAGRTIGALRRWAIRNHPEERNDSFAGIGARHLSLLWTRRPRPAQRSHLFHHRLMRLSDAPPTLILPLSLTGDLMILGAAPPIWILPESFTCE